jgi:hypothetical protein
MSFRPTWVGVLRADGPWNPVFPIGNQEFGEVRLLVQESGGLRWQLGPIEVVTAGVDRGLWDPVPLSDGTRADPLTVAICTRDNPRGLERTIGPVITALASQDELLIIDNAPSDQATYEIVRAQVGAGRPVRYVREDRPGLSRARNRALEEARTDLLLFTDDDVSVDLDWIDATYQAFAHPETAIVTGQAPSAAIMTPSQAAFDRRVRWSSTMRTVFTQDWSAPDEPGYPFSAGVFGTGANMSLRRSRLAEYGAFDVRLGAGTRTKGGEDLDMFVRVILGGGQIVKEPRSIVWHHHRDTWELARRHAMAYGRGLGAYVAAALSRHPRPSTLRKMIARSGGFGSARSNHIERDAQHQRLLLNETIGLASGPACFALEHALHAGEARRAREVRSFNN